MTKLTLLPCRKGPFWEAMSRKLQQLGRGRTNEIRRFDFGELAFKLDA
jgi:hypothetical protein